MRAHAQAQAHAPAEIEDSEAPPEPFQTKLSGYDTGVIRDLLY